MGGEQALAETVGRTEDQADREEQRAGGSTKTNQSSQRDASTVCKLSQHIRDLHPSSCSLQYLRGSTVHHIGGPVTFCVGSECRNISESTSDSPSFPSPSCCTVHSCLITAL